jgi:hypothetical protein
MQALARNSHFAPVFVVGFPRSGTTLLATLLDRHSQLAIASETSFFLQHFQEELFQSMRTGVLPKKGVIESVLASLQLDAQLLWSNFVQMQPCDPNTFLRLILQQYSQLRNKPRCGEKSPWHLLSVPTLLSSFPNARVIGIIRDGRDAVLSLSQTPFGAQEDIRFHCLEWTRAAKLFRRFSHQFARFLWVRYEDLIHTPDIILPRICEFVGITYEPEQLSPETISDTVRQDGPTWQEKALQQIDSSRAHAWQREASLAFRDSATNLMFDELARLDYDVESFTGCGTWRPQLERIKYLPKYWLRKVIRRSRRYWPHE